MDEQLVAVGLDEGPERWQHTRSNASRAGNVSESRAISAIAHGATQRLPRRRLALPYSTRVARPSWPAPACRRRPTNASTPSTTTTSRKPQNHAVLPMPPNGSAISLTIPKPSTITSTIEQDHEQDAADPARQAGALGRRDDAHHAQHQQLAVRRRRAAELLRGDLQVAGAALGEGQRSLGHAPQLQALLRARGGDRGAEVLAGLLGVHALGRARAEDGLRGGLEAGLLLAAPRRSGARAAASRSAPTWTRCGLGGAWAAWPSQSMAPAKADGCRIDVQRADRAAPAPGSSAS